MPRSPYAMTIKWRRWLVGFVFGVVVVSSAGACGGDSDEAVPSTGSPEGSGAAGADEVEPTPTPTVDAAGVEAEDVTEWEVTDLGSYITYPAPFEGGYVALMDDEVAVSADGLSWVLMEPQPFETEPTPENQRALVVSADGLIAVDAVSGFDVQAALLRNGEWQNIAIEGIESFPEPGAGVGASLQVGVGPDGVVLSLVSEVFWVFDGESFRSASEVAELTWFGVWNRVGWVEDIEPPPTLTGPDWVRDAAEWNGRIVAAGWPKDDAPAWTSTDGGETWEPVPELVTEWQSSNCGPPPSESRLTAEFVEAGPLGWLAAGSWCAPPVWWLSPDGITWDQLEDAPNVTEWDIMVPFPPSILIEEDRIVVYGSSAVSVLTP